MTLEIFNSILKFYDIPESAIIKSDSGWECYETDVGGIFYNPESNVLTLTQSGTAYEREFKEGHQLLCSVTGICTHCSHKPLCNTCSLIASDSVKMMDGRVVCCKNHRPLKI